MLRGDLLSISDLKPGMELDGTVRNVIDFGVFVDIGVHQDGLVHISQIADGFIRHPSEVLSVNDKVRVRVLDVDLNKNKISLTMKTADKPYGLKKKEEKKPGEKGARPNGNADRGGQNRDNRNNRGYDNRGGYDNRNRGGYRPKQEQKEESLEDAVKRLQERFRLG